MTQDALDERRAELRSYQIGLAAAVILTTVPFGAVALTEIRRDLVGALITTCALAQVYVHFRYFLHIDLSRQKREDLHLILFSTLLLILMAGGTVWVLSDLSTRMMASTTHTPKTYNAQ